MTGRKKTLSQLFSLERLQLWTKSIGGRIDGREELARKLLTALKDADPDAACAAVLASCLPDHFYNMAATTKRRFFDGISVALCDNNDDEEALFDLLKEENWTGRTKRS
jgi:hypothetical protein